MAGKNTFEVEGLERAFSVSSGCSTNIAHILTIDGPADLIQSRLPDAFIRVVNRHPRMRTLQLKEEPLKAITSPEISSVEEAMKNIRFFKAQDGKDWKMLVEEEGNLPRDRSSNLPFHLALVTDDSDKSRLILFSDHYTADGFSGMIILNDILNQITQPCQLETLPLRPSIYSILVPQKTWLGSLESFALWLLKSWISSAFASLKPALPIRPDIGEFTLPFNSKPFPTKALFNTGSDDNLKSALAKSKAEKVTLHGPVVVAVALAHAITRYSLGLFDETKDENIKLFLEIDYNMRKRIPEPFDELNVGFFICIAPLKHLSNNGLSLNEKFWDAAREAKKETDAFDHYGLESRGTLRFIHQFVNAKENQVNMKLENGSLNDINLSNIGKYPFQTVYKFSGGENEIKIKECHLYNSYQTIGPSMIVFLSSVSSLCYSMAHRVPDQVAQKFFETYVKIIENIGNIKSDETIGDIFHKFK